jgi:uncharacterized protein (DUF362 family)
MNRRFFLKTCSTLLAYFGYMLSIPHKLWGEFTGLPEAQSGTGKTRVVLVRNSSVMTNEGLLVSTVADEMLTSAMLRLTSKSTPDKAWGELFRPEDVVGIKVNALGGKRIATHPGVVDAVVAGLKRAGVPENNIIVWDRLTDELQKAGYGINRSGRGVGCYGTDKSYDPNPEMSGSIGSCFSTILSSHCTALINVPVLKDHDLAGVSIGLKNFYGAIHNPNKYHDNNCDPFIADLNMHPYIKNKLRLIVCDALTLLYQGGPAYNPQHAIDYSGLLVSQDPVALDRIGVNLIEEARKEKGLPTLKEAGREPVHVATAAQRGLGTDDLKGIEWVKIL